MTLSAMTPARTASRLNYLTVITRRGENDLDANNFPFEPGQKVEFIENDEDAPADATILESRHQHDFWYILSDGVTPEQKAWIKDHGLTYNMQTF